MPPFYRIIEFLLSFLGVFIRSACFEWFTVIVIASWTAFIIQT
jgi:hypothetical protein